MRNSSTDLHRVEAVVAGAVAGDGLLGAAAAHLTKAKAKRARPRLLLAFASIAGDRAVHADAVVRCAAAVELIHTASLLHDDVVDDAAERRSIPSANASYGNGVAVLAGDVVLARALSMLAFDPRAIAAAIDTVARMSAAGVREIELRPPRYGTPRSASLDDVIAIADGKTGALFGLCGRLAAIAVDAPDATANALESAGCAFGVAFQIADDISDVEEDARVGAATVPLVASLSEARALVEAHLQRARESLAPFAAREGHGEVHALAVAIGQGLA